MVWILESLGDDFQGKKQWLRPGKKVLFGRTRPQGEHSFVISDKALSRRHLTIEVDNSNGADPRKRSTCTVTDLGSKSGTKVNGETIKDEKRVLTADTNDFRMGTSKTSFRVTWRPVVFTFSFTATELRSDAWAVVQQKLDELDIRYIGEYDVAQTTHVIAKKRNSIKGLQALINGKYIVHDSFMEALSEAAKPVTADDGTTTTSALETDFEGSWPDERQHLPPRAEAGGITQSDEIWGPDERRKEIFDGYTFIFYESKQHENLFPAITNGKGKSLLKQAVPGETDLDGFIRYVKGVAGEKGLGEFEDGSEGKGVVLVKHIPTKGPHVEWYKEFYTNTALRLDHRPIDQRDFMEAVLDVHPGMLRRPLEVERTQPEPASSQRAPSQRPVSQRPVSQRPVSQHAPSKRAEPENADEMEVDEPREQSVVEKSSSPPPRARRGRERRAPTRRFKGFDADIDDDEDEVAPAPQPSVAQPEVEEEAPEELSVAQRSQRKRPADPMEDIAPTAALLKRRRIEQGETPVPQREPTPPPEPEKESPPPAKGRGKGKAPAKGRGKKVKETDDILDLAIQQREETEAVAKAEREQLAHQLAEDDIDYEEIRRLTIVEPMEVRRPQVVRSREKDVEEGRWDPQWNGRKNFKRFRKQGEPAGRAAPKVIMSLEPVKMKEYGIGDNYWLEDTVAEERRRVKRSQLKETQTQITQTFGRSQAAGRNGRAAASPMPVSQRTREATVLGSDSEDEDVGEDASLPDVMDIEVAPPRSRKGKAAEKASTRQSQAQTQARGSAARSSNKRAAVEPPAKEKPAKKPATRATRKTKDSDDDDDSDDGLKFRFGKRK